MKHIHELNLIEDNFVILESYLCGQAHKLRSQFEIDIQKCVEDIVFSYFNNLNRTISAYSKIFNLVQSSSTKFPDLLVDERLHHAFKDVDHEIVLNDYSYIFFSSLKSSMDMLACIIDFIDKRNCDKIIEKEYYLDIMKLNVSSEFKRPIIYQFRDSACVKKVIDFRNKIAHKGHYITSHINPLPNMIFQQNISQGYRNSNKSEFDISTLLSDYLKVVRKFDFELSQQNSISAPVAKAKFNDYFQIFDFEGINQGDRT